MLTEEQILVRLRQSESTHVERKRSRQNPREIRTTLVAFANALGPDEHAVLFLGVGPDGAIVGLEDADTDQRELAKIAAEECFPRVPCEFRVLTIEAKEILAVVIPASTKRPHFTGHAYVRIGSENKKASDQMFNEMIASRNDKARRLIAVKGKLVEVELRPKKTYYTPVGVREIEWRDYRLLDCDAHFVIIEDVTYMRQITEPLENVQICPTKTGKALKLIFTNANHDQF